MGVSRPVVVWVLACPKHYTYQQPTVLIESKNKANGEISFFSPLNCLVTAQVGAFILVYSEDIYCSNHIKSSVSLGNFLFELNENDLSLLLFSNEAIYFLHYI